jgi:hypothetical protein
MAPVPPARPDLEALAERALGFLDGPGQATAWWERGLDGAGVRVEVLAVRDGRAAAALAHGSGDADLQAAAHRAAEAAPAGHAVALPDPVHGRSHEAYDPACATVGPGALPGEHGDARLTWAVSAAKIAIASTRGVRAYEERSLAAVEATAERDGRAVTLTAAGAGPGRIDAEALAAEALSLLGAAPPEPVAAGEPDVVLGPQAVAAVLDHARPDFAPGGALEARRGDRVVASTINLADSPRFPGTLARSYDGYGVPRTPAPLLQDGVVHRLAAQPPTHFVLVGGGAAALEELLSPVSEGLYVPVIAGGRTRGAFHVRGGRLAAPAADAPVGIDAFAVLACTRALGARQRTFLVGPPSARIAGATVAPALRAAGGLAFGS